jgi:hypothetical protein
MVSLLLLLAFSPASADVRLDQHFFTRLGQICEAASHNTNVRSERLCADLIMTARAAMGDPHARVPGAKVAAAEMKLGPEWFQKLGMLCEMARYGSRMQAEPICNELSEMAKKAVEAEQHPQPPPATTAPTTEQKK